MTSHRWWFRPDLNRRPADYEPAALPTELRNQGSPAGIPAGAPHRVERAAAYGLQLIKGRGERNVKTLLEGGAGFEPTASHCAVGVLPEAPSAHVAGLSRLSACSHDCVFIPQGSCRSDACGGDGVPLSPTAQRVQHGAGFPAPIQLSAPALKSVAIVGEAGIEPAF